MGTIEIVFCSIYEIFRQYRNKKNAAKDIIPPNALLQKQIVNERRQSTIRLEKRKMEIQRMKIINEKNLVDDGRDDK